MPTLKFQAKAASENPTRTVVETSGFKIVIDEPRSLGGTNGGPNPVEYVLAALAGCLNVVGHIVAKEMGITMRGIEIELEGGLDPAKFMGQATDVRTGYQNIIASIKPDCDADEDALAQWLEAIESRCPVSDNISNATPVEIRLA